MTGQLYEIISPRQKDSTRASDAYDAVQLTAIVASVVPLAFKEPYPMFDIIEYVCVAIFIIDYLLRWSTADRYLGKGWKSFLLYPLKPMAIIDLLSILPTFTFFDQAFHLFRLSRLFGVIRLFRFGRYSRSLTLVISVMKKQQSVLLSVLWLAVFYIVLTALIMFSVDDQFENFFEALYWSTSALTTVGYGDVCPHNDIGRIISMISSLVGVAIIALPSGVITASYLETIAKSNGDADDNRTE